MSREEVYTPLLPPAVMDPNQQLSGIAQLLQDKKKIYPTEMRSSASAVIINEATTADPVENITLLQKAVQLLSTLLSYFKFGLACAVLICRFLTCLYRALPNEDAVRLFFSMPGLDAWQESKGVDISAIVLGSFFALTDGIQTVKTNKDGVFTLFCDPNWLATIKNFGQSIRERNYPVLFLFLFMASVLPGSWSKAEVAITDGLLRLNNASDTQMSEMQSYAIICTISFLSTISSSIFLFQKAAWVLRSYEALHNKPEWIAFLKDNSSWLRKIKLIGISQAIMGAFANCISLFYKHHRFQFEIGSLIEFLFVGITGAFCNYGYTYHPVYLFESIVSRDQLEKQKNSVLQTTQTTQTDEKVGWREWLWHGAKNANAFFSVTGAAILQSTAFIRSLQVILLAAFTESGKEGFKTAANSEFFLVPAAVLSLFFGWGAFAQNMAMWGNKVIEKPRNTIVDDVPVVISELRR